jgi:hypothetical protein
VTALLAAAGCGCGADSTSGRVEVPPEIAELQAAGKSPREIRKAKLDLEVKKALQADPKSRPLRKE